jgi:hypothetical protein
LQDSFLYEDRARADPGKLTIDRTEKFMITAYYEILAFPHPYPASGNCKAPMGPWAD